MELVLPTIKIKVIDSKEERKCRAKDITAAKPLSFVAAKDVKITK